MALNNFTQALILSGSAQQLNSNPVFVNVTITAKSTNTGNIAIGFSNAITTSNSYLLEKGQSITIYVPNANAIWVNGTTSDILSVIGS